MSNDSTEQARVAGHGRNPDASAPTRIQAEIGRPAAEYGQYGMVREGSREAQGLSEPQIRGTEPMVNPKQEVLERARHQQAVPGQPTAGRDSAFEDGATRPTR